MCMYLHLIFGFEICLVNKSCCVENVNHVVVHGVLFTFKLINTSPVDIF